MNPYILSVNSVQVRIAGRQILQNAGFWVEPGRVTAIFGRNGCGKTTIIRSALGLRRCQYRSVIWKNRRDRIPTMAEMAREGLFYMPDRNTSVNFASMGTHIAWLRRRFGVFDESWLHRMGLGGIHERKPHTFSGGELKLAELALAAGREAECLLLDEPLDGLGPRALEVALKTIREMADGGAGILLTGHQARDLLSVSDQVIWMTGGTTVHLGSPEEALEHRGFRQSYLARHNR